MADQKNDKQCAHPNCNCAVSNDEEYCSPHCESAPKAEITCGCGHASCLTGKMATTA